MRRLVIALLLIGLVVLPGCLASVAAAPFEAAAWTVEAAVDVTATAVTAVGDVIGGEDADEPTPGRVTTQVGPPACVT